MKINKIKKPNYQFTNKMAEISGFGGKYENYCRKMVIAGINWCNEHPKANLSHKEYKHIYGLTTAESPDTKLMQEVIFKAVDNKQTNFMEQATLGHIMFIYKNGWDKYVKEMVKKKQKDLLPQLSEEAEEQAGIELLENQRQNDTENTQDDNEHSS